MKENKYFGFKKNDWKMATGLSFFIVLILTNQIGLWSLPQEKKYEYVESYKVNNSERAHKIKRDILQELYLEFHQVDLMLAMLDNRDELKISEHLLDEILEKNFFRAEYKIGLALEKVINSKIKYYFPEYESLQIIQNQINELFEFSDDAKKYNDMQNLKISYSFFHKQRKDISSKMFIGYQIYNPNPNELDAIYVKNFNMDKDKLNQFILSSVKKYRSRLK